MKSRNLTSLRDALPMLLGEPSFWLILAGIGFSAGSHALIEFSGSHLEESGLWGELANLTTFLYVVPLAYAAFRFGMRGGLWTAIVIMVLTLPNIALSHPEAFGWLGETVSVLFVILAGLGIGVILAQEREAREASEKVGSRLLLLNEVAGSLARVGDPIGLVNAVLDCMVESLPLEAAVFSPTASADVVPTWCGAGGSTAQQRLADAMQVERPLDGNHAALRTGRTVTVPVTTDRDLLGGLAVTVHPGAHSLPIDIEILRAIADELAVALDYARLQASERNHLRRYAANLIQAQEDERSKVARDLHDDVAQALVTLARRLRDLAASNHLAQEGIAEADSLRGMVDEIQNSVRSTSKGLRPPVLDDLGLQSAIASLAADYDGEDGAAVVFNSKMSVDRLAPEVEVAIYRITQEAVRNAVLHSGASRVTIMLSTAEACLRLRVVDEGRGFAIEAPGQRGSGIQGMRERAQLIGGRLEIDTAPGSGTVVQLILG